MNIMKNIKRALGVLLTLSISFTLFFSSNVNVSAQEVEHLVSSKKYEFTLRHYLNQDGTTTSKLVSEFEALRQNQCLTN
jgi:hypothetical protein